MLAKRVALWAITSRGTAFGARYRRIIRHRAHEKAVGAVAHALLVTAHRVLARQTPFAEAGADYYDRRHAERIARCAVYCLSQTRPKA